MASRKTTEERRLESYRSRRSNWKHWGPYLSDRSWGTVREDYSAAGTAWDYFPHDHARSRAYRWGEDGIAGISDRNQFLCFALSFWNGRDPILKERMFGVDAQQGNHGEDVKELYYYVDSTPTHSYMRMLYKYPHARFPYEQLVDESRRRSRNQPEFEIVETGVFDESRYFDCDIEYAKAQENDILIRIRIVNRGPDRQPLHIIPTLWFRNLWSWGYAHGPMRDLEGDKPRLWKADTGRDRAGFYSLVHADHSCLGRYSLYAHGSPELLFTENETHYERLFGVASASPYHKDAFNRYLIEGEKSAVNPHLEGTKVGVHYFHEFAPGEEASFILRLAEGSTKSPFSSFEQIFASRRIEADEFYEHIQSAQLSAEEKNVQRQALAGMLWSKQLFYLDVEQWMSGDPVGPPPPEGRSRNRDWSHLVNFDIISMPDKWEFPWYAAWDLAFHCIPLSLVDADFAKRQLELMTREWYMHPNGQLPAYEWAFADVNPPVHAWAAWRVYKIDAKQQGRKDVRFLEGIFHKLLLNFTWWVNRKDAQGNNIFQGGFLGLDNIGVFDRSAPLPGGGHIDQADGTSWMAAYCLQMLRMSIELSQFNPVYQDTASKFLEHFLRVAHAMINIGGAGQSLWDDGDGFFYDVLNLPNGTNFPLRVRSLVGLIPLFAVDTIDGDVLHRMPDFKRRLDWFTTNRPHLTGNMARMDVPGEGDRRLFAILTKERLVRVLNRMFDEEEFLSEYGIRSLSKYHDKHPFQITVENEHYSVKYDPAESTTFLFGGNSNWRGPVWFPINFILIEALQRFHHYYGDDFKVEYPTGSGNMLNLDKIAEDLSKRLAKLFALKDDGTRPCLGPYETLQRDPFMKGLLLFNEYFNPENGQGLGASHQTGWTGIIAKILQQLGEHRAGS